MKTFILILLLVLTACGKDPSPAVSTPAVESSLSSFRNYWKAPSGNFTLLLNQDSTYTASSPSGFESGVYIDFGTHITFTAKFFALPVNPVAWNAVTQAPFDCAYTISGMMLTITCDAAHVLRTASPVSLTN